MDARPHDADDPTGEPADPTDPAAPEPADGSADEPDVETRWAEIVAQLGDLGTGAGEPGTGSGPASGGRPERRGRTEPWHRADGPRPARRDDTGRSPDDGAGTSWGAVDPGAGRDGGSADLGAVPPSDRELTGPERAPDAAGPRAWVPDPDVEEAEDHFEPPDPGPVLAGDPLLTMAWSAVVGVPALLLVAVLVWRDMPTVVLQVAGVAFVLGIALLVWRMPRGDEPPEGPGAVV